RRRQQRRYICGRWHGDRPNLWSDQRQQRAARSATRGTHQLLMYLPPGRRSALCGLLLLPCVVRKTMKKNLFSRGALIFVFTPLWIAMHGDFCLAESSRTAQDWVTVQSIVGKIHGVSTTPPKNLITPKFTSGALMGNGDIGVVAGDTTTAQQRFS